MANHPGLAPARPMPMAVLRQSAASPLAEAAVQACLGPAAIDAVFTRGWRAGPASLTRRQRNAVAGVTGHIAEVLLNDLGWHILWHFTGPGRHGVDLVFLAPGDKVVAVEVKGTLVARRIPRLSRRELAQMSPSWIDQAGNPGMTELRLDSDDVYGGVVVVNFADLVWRTALTADFCTLMPVSEAAQLADLDWLAAEPEARRS